MTKIKICGLRRIEDVDYVNKAKPDFAGFILAPGFRRTIDINTLRVLKSSLDKEIKAVGVFINEDIANIVSLVNEKLIDIVQLHGHENDLYVKQLKEAINAPIIKVYEDSAYCDYVMVDNIKPGSGERSNDIIITNKPLFIAGGLNIGNIKDVLKLKPYCVDISSGVETDGYKDEAKINEIVRLVRNYE